MKKLLLISFSILISYKTNAQVMFCPPGAEWHYAYKFMPSPQFPSGEIFNQQVKYVRDSVIGTDVFKVLKHDRYFMTCNLEPGLTILKHVGDTIFFRNSYTHHTWQILYNFNCAIGNNWVITIYDTPTTTRNFTFTVQSVSTVTINGFNLKQIVTDRCTITERMGSNLYFFSFDLPNASACDLDYFYKSLCYQDNTFGLYKFSTLDCDYDDRLYVGIKENSIPNNLISLYPNPVTDILNIETTEEVELSFKDIYGREVKNAKIKQEREINIEELKKGIYFLSATKNKELIYTTKLIKE